MNLFNLATSFQIALAWVISTAFFTALIVYISKHPLKRTTPMRIIFLVIFIGGMAMHCTFNTLDIKQAQESETVSYQLKWVKESGADSFFVTSAYVVIKSIIDVGAMFYGRIDSSAFYNLPLSQNPYCVLIFWLVNLMTFYITATALLIRFGNDLLRWIRRVTSKASDVNLIYGVNSDSLAFGRNIAASKGSMLVYVESVARDDYEGTIRELGGIAYSDEEAVKGTAEFLRRIRVKPNKTRLRLYALSSEYDKNLQYARVMSDTLKQLEISPDYTELVLLGTEERKRMGFQATKSQYGYGDVVSFDEYEMSASLLIHKYPLCDAINFDENGRATEDMNALVVGFGRIGHEVLRKIIANGQFEGSNFHATVYDPNFEQRTGFFRSQYPNMFANYDIDFEPHGGRGIKIFKFLQENASRLKYIVVCIDDRETARDIAIHMADRLQTLGYPLNVYTCDTKSVRCYSQYVNECETHWIYDSELLYSGELDKYAIELNHRYCGGKSAKEDWKQCSYFDRMSSRASVDYLIPLIKKIRSKTNSDTLTPEQRENLARSEHLRWCAFHYTFGFDVMSLEEFTERVKARQDEIRQFGKSGIKVTKDTKNLTHVCLVDWDELDEVADLENSLTHGNRNYKDSDRNNVDMVAKLVPTRSKNVAI